MQCFLVYVSLFGCRFCLRRAKNKKGYCAFCLIEAFLDLQLHVLCKKSMMFLIWGLVFFMIWDNGISIFLLN